MKVIKIYKSPIRAIRLIFLCSVFIAIGYGGILYDKMDHLIAYLIIGFFSLGYPVAIFNLLDRRPQIIMNEMGFYNRTVCEESLNWEVIQDAYLINIQKQKFICLLVDEKYKPSYNNGNNGQPKVKLKEIKGMKELNISLGPLKINAEKLLQFILLMRAADQQEKIQLIRNFERK